MSSSAASTDATPQPDSGANKSDCFRRDDLLIVAVSFAGIPTFHAT
jgi:hypothetical protein